MSKITIDLDQLEDYLRYIKHLEGLLLAEDQGKRFIKCDDCDDVIDTFARSPHNCDAQVRIIMGGA